MAVSFRAVGTWAELIADGSVAIPATPQAGDRMYLFARWKDFSVTAEVTSPVTWDEISEFADGTNNSGNGTGSVKVACWYRDWQSGDTDPTIDFSANPNNASAVIIIMAKAAGNAWLTPVAVTAAMTTWTSSSQSVSASSTADVLGGSVVMGLIGIRDDTATMTRPTNGIDDASSAITWNGDYVEAPATHHSTTTGDDGAADLGYRLVTTGAAGATLRMTGTISASETGSALWVVQGIESNLTVDDAAHAHSAASATLTQVHSITVQDAAHAQSAANSVLTQDHILVVQDAAHTQSVDSLTATQEHVLSVQNASHDQAVESVSLEVIHNLTVNDAAHSHSSQNISLTQVHELVVANAAHVHTAQSPNVRTFLPVWIDPGGDAVQAVGYFNSALFATGQLSFDSTQKVVGVGSWKFDSGTDQQVAATIPVSLPAAGRLSTYFRYDSVPDKTVTDSEFCEDNAIYSGGGFADPAFFNADDGFYATATPAKNAGQGSKCIPVSPLDIPQGAVIDSVKIIYERKYDVDTSIGISRVKWVINGSEGPNHDNTAMPLTDTVVEVDVTSDFGWTWQDLQQGVFEVVAEARRGDTDTAHTQSWDFLKVEVVYHNPAAIMQLRNADGMGSEISISPKGSGVVLRLADGAGNSFDGITILSVDTDYRISFTYTLRASNDLDVTVYVDGIQEVFFENGSSGSFATLPILYYGWIQPLGNSHLCWFDQLFIDDGWDMLDPGDKRSTAKLPASVNEDNWDTTGGTGAVGERPLSVTNYRQETRITGFNQSYTLQTAATGDVDISGEDLYGYMGWAWAKLGVGSDDFIYLRVNGTNIDQGGQLSTAQKLLKHNVASVSYPSNAAGIGMVSNNDTADTFMYECGVVVGYQGPDINPNRILAYQRLEQGATLDLTDDLRAAPPSSYEFCFRSSESEVALALVTVSSLDQEGGGITPQTSLEINGGVGRMRITAGIEVQVHVEITGGPIWLGLWHRLNVDT